MISNCSKTYIFYKVHTTIRDYKNLDYIIYFNHDQQNYNTNIYTRTQENSNI